MRKRNSRKASSSSQKALSSGSLERVELSARLPSDYSLPTLAVKGAEEYLNLRTYEVQVTVRSRVELSRVGICKLAGFALSEILEKGLSVTDWFLLEYLYSYLLGSKLSPLERKDNKERELSQLLKLCLLSGTWLGLEGKRQIPEDIRQLLEESPWVPKGRTKSSWQQYWQLDKFLEIQLVPLDLFLERSKGTQRYSSYCKGYGESSRMGRRQKTPPSAELDGEPVDLGEELVTVQLQDLERLFNYILKEVKYQTGRR